MSVKILFRKSLAEETEFNIAQRYFSVIEHRTNVCKEDIVVGRYSVLPYYKELEQDLKNIGASLINSYKQYNYVADLQNWYNDIKKYTPQTWFKIEDIPYNQDGPFILKGATNSRKQLWRTHMFAKNKKDAIDVMLNLFNDSLLQYQGICIRKYEPLINYGEDPITHCPISKEFRFFIINKKIAAGGFYWSNFYEDIKLKPDTSEVPLTFINKIIDLIGDNVNFWTLDVAQKVNGEWIVIEIGDGQMSGVSCCDVEQLYKNLKNYLI